MRAVPRGRSRRSAPAAPPPAPMCSSVGLAFQATDELVELKLLERVADGVQLGGAQLDQLLALAHERERLVEARLPRVQPANDLLDARRGGLVAGPGLPPLARGGLRACRPLVGAHRSSGRAPRTPSAKRIRSSGLAAAAAALASARPSGVCTTAYPRSSVRWGSWPERTRASWASSRGRRSRQSRVAAEAFRPRTIASRSSRR